MEASLGKWLERDELPPDLYGLLGRKRFDPDIDGLQAAVRAAARELMQYQNHQDASIVRRAIQLQHELGRAADVLADPQKLKAYHEELLCRLAQEYAQKADLGGGTGRAGDLLQWLEHEQEVHSRRCQDNQTTGAVGDGGKRQMCTIPCPSKSLFAVVGRGRVEKDGAQESGDCVAALQRAAVAAGILECGGAATALGFMSLRRAKRCRIMQIHMNLLDNAREWCKGI